MPQRLAVGGVVAKRLIRGHARRHRCGALVAEVFHAGSAPAAVPADRDERHHDVIANRESGYAAADFNDGARAFVSADHGEHWCQAVLTCDLIGDRHVALEDVVVGVAQACCGHLDENLAGARRIELEILDRPRAAHIMQDRGAASHDRVSLRRLGRRGRKVTGRRLGERNGMPEIFVSSSGTSCRPVTRSNRLFSIARVSTRAGCMPRQLWMPPAKEMCARRGRWMSNTSASGHRVSSRLAEPMQRLTCAPFGIVLPCISTSRVVLRVTRTNGVSYRIPSSIAAGIRSRSCWSARSWSGWVSSSASRLLDDRYVVSNPAGRSKRRNEMIASSVSFSPSISAATRSPMTSSVILLRRWSTCAWK